MLFQPGYSVWVTCFTEKGQEIEKDQGIFQGWEDHLLHKVTPSPLLLFKNESEKEDTYSFFVSLVQEMHRRFENAPDSAKTKALQTVIEMKVRKNLIIL